MTATIFHKIFLVVFIILLALALYVKKDTVFSGQYLGNLHMHTTCSDGESGYEEMIQASIALKFAFVALTDHTICPDMIEACAKETRILCIPGQEVTGERTHLLALNVKQYVNQHMSLTKQAEIIHGLGGLAIAAHPNAKDFLYTDTELAGSGIDAMECTDNTDERRPLTCVWDSDAHNAHDLGWQFMSCSKKINNFEDLKTAILTKKCSRSFLPDFFPVRSPKVSI